MYSTWLPVGANCGPFNCGTSIRSMIVIGRGDWAVAVATAITMRPGAIDPRSIFMAPPGRNPRLTNLLRPGDREVHRPLDGEVPRLRSRRFDHPEAGDRACGTTCQTIVRSLVGGNLGM